MYEDGVGEIHSIKLILCKYYSVLANKYYY